MLLCKVQHFCCQYPSRYECDGRSYYSYKYYRLRQTRSQLIIDTVDARADSQNLALQVCDRHHSDQFHLSDEEAFDALSKSPKIELVFAGPSSDILDYLAQPALEGDTPFRRAARGILRSNLKRYLKSPFKYEAREILIPEMIQRASMYKACRCETWY